MDIKHTKGPWVMETVRTQSGICHKIGPFPGRRDDDKPRHACLYADYPSPSNPNDVELQANARLIAAAPELLHVAEAVVAAMTAEESLRGIILAGISGMARSAIAKATGAES